MICQAVIAVKGTSLSAITESFSNADNFAELQFLPAIEFFFYTSPSYILTTSLCKPMSQIQLWVFFARKTTLNSKVFDRNNTTKDYKVLTSSV